MVKPKSRTVFNLPIPVKKKLQKMAVKERRTMVDVVIQMIEERRAV